MARAKATLFVATTATIETKQVDINLDTDPTGVVPTWQFTAEDSTDPDGSWVAGSWNGYANERAKAVTPSLGKTGSGADITFAGTADVTMRAWIKFTAGSQTIVRPAGYLRLVA